MNLASKAKKPKINNNMMMTNTGIKWTLNQLKNLNNFSLYIPSLYL
jgi:hypothetical protein